MMKHTRALRARWVLLSLFGLALAWFFLLERLIPVPTYWLHVRLDDYIPFLPVFVVPYVMWYLYLAVPAAWLLFKRPEEGCRLLAYLAAGMSIACFVYTVLPNGVPLRPDTLGNGPFNAVIRLLYAIDTPTNSAPSLHVIQAIGAHGAIARMGARSRRPRLVRGCSFVLLVLITLSTVFIKQHSVIDLFSGLLVGSVLYFAVYGRVSPAYRRMRLALHKA